MENFKSWEDNYWNNPKIDLYKYFTNEDLEILEKLNIQIQNRLYTEREYELINKELLYYYEENKKKFPIPSQRLIDKKINFDAYMHLLKIFSKISTDYEL